MFLAGGLALACALSVPPVSPHLMLSLSPPPPPCALHTGYHPILGGICQPPSAPNELFLLSGTGAAVGVGRRGDGRGRRNIGPRNVPRGDRDVAVRHARDR